MINRIITMSIVMMLYCMSAAASVPSIVFLKFADNTPYKDIGTTDIIENLMLDKLFSLNDFILMERNTAQDVLAIEQNLQNSDAKVKQAVTERDFDYLFSASENDLAVKQQGEFLPVEKTRLLGSRHQAEYILHGSIDYLGKDSHTAMVPLKNFAFSNVTPYLEAVATVRIIRASTGEIVWKRQERGASKESLIRFKGLTFGSGDFSNQLFYEALDKISSKIVDALKKDLKNHNLILEAK